MNPKLIVISAPSGSGKTSIAHEILKRHTEIEFSISATTRPQRPGEVNGKDYYFLQRADFERSIHEGKFIEWEEIFGNLYGTLKSEIARIVGSGKSLLFDVDVKGAISIKRQFPDALLIFIKPPSMAVLYTRLVNRNTDDPESLSKRLERVPMELLKENEFDYQVVNDNLEQAIAEVEAIIFNNDGTSRRMEIVH
ncbi:MAG: guanylate kinase [Bacteroidota bacterium]